MTTPQARSTLATLALVLAGLPQSGCSSSPEAPGSRHGEALLVSTRAVTTAQRSEVVEIGGSVEARTTAVLAARIVAPVEAVTVAPGDRVRTGDLLVRLDSRDLAAAARRATALVEAAQRSVEAATADEQAAHAALRFARATHGRITALAEKRSVTAQELDEATAALAAADARLAAARARTLETSSALESARAASDAADATASFTRIVAPFDGLITEKRVEAGNMTMPGAPLLVLEDTGGFRFNVRIDESTARSIAIGASISVLIEGAAAEPDATLDGIVTEVARAVDSGTHTVLVKITLPTRPWLRTGMFGRATFSGRSRQALVVPPDAVIRRGQLTTVFTAENDIARLRIVNLAGDEVISGLSSGEIVIVRPPAGLLDGRRIRTGGR